MLTVSVLLTNRKYFFEQLISLAQFVSYIFKASTSWSSRCFILVQEILP